MIVFTQGNNYAVLNSKVQDQLREVAVDRGYEHKTGEDAYFILHRLIVVADYPLFGQSHLCDLVRNFYNKGYEVPAVTILMSWLQLQHSTFTAHTI